MVTTEPRVSANTVTRQFTASVYKDRKWYVAQALDIDVASQGKSVEEALDNLREALTLHFEPPFRELPELHRIEVEVPAPAA